jgi:hypothetical protein
MASISSTISITIGILITTNIPGLNLAFAVELAVHPVWLPSCLNRFKTCGLHGFQTAKHIKNAQLFRRIVV